MSMKDISDVQVCRAVQAFCDRDRDLPWPYEALALETGQSEKVCFRAMERACTHGLIEYGVSLRTGWLTEKGRELVRQNQKVENFDIAAQKLADVIDEEILRRCQK